MKLIELNNAYQVKDLDINDDEACKELGYIVADKCVVFVDQPISEKRLYEIQTMWGQPSNSLVHQAVTDRRLDGNHWREMLLNLGYIASNVKQYEGMVHVSYEKNKRGKPTGLFTNGELDWHCDQQASEAKQRIIGLSSLHGSKNSQTSFMCTAKMYESLNHEDKTMVDELINVYKWDGGSVSKDLIPSQLQIVRYASVPMDFSECSLLSETASGRKGIKFPSHCFDRFYGMDQDESIKVKEYLWSKLNKPENIYMHDWQDGQAVFMDQNITLHARPTNVKDGDKRTMARMVTFLDKLYEHQNDEEFYRWKGQYYDEEAFLDIIDQARKQEYIDEIRSV